MSNVQLGVLFTEPYASYLLHGLLMTGILVISSWSLAVAVGTCVALIRSTGNLWCEWLCALYVAYHRNVPGLVHMLLWYFGISALLPMPIQIWMADHGGETAFASIGLGLCMSAYFAEDIRSGLRSVSSGQYEAARAIGFGYVGAMRNIIMPQAIRAALPSFINNSVVLFKNTSMAMAIGVAELTYAVRQIENDTFRTFEIYAFGTACYLVGSFGIMALGTFCIRRLQIRGQ